LGFYLTNVLLLNAITEYGIASKNYKLLKDQIKTLAIIQK